MSFASRASALYNVVPPAIKSLLTLTSFKPALDAFLNEFPDTPLTPVLGTLDRTGSQCWSGPVARISDTLLHGGGDARHSWPGSTLARNPTKVTQVSNPLNSNFEHEDSR